MCMCVFSLYFFSFLSIWIASRMIWFFGRSIQSIQRWLWCVYATVNVTSNKQNWNSLEIHALSENESMKVNGSNNNIKNKKWSTDIQLRGNECSLWCIALSWISTEKHTQTSCNWKRKSAQLFLLHGFFHFCVRVLEKRPIKIHNSALKMYYLELLRWCPLTTSIQIKN